MPTTFKVTEVENTPVCHWLQFLLILKKHPDRMGKKTTQHLRPPLSLLDSLLRSPFLPLSPVLTTQCTRRASHRRYLQHISCFCNIEHLMTHTQRLSLGGWRAEWLKECCFVAVCWCRAVTVSFEEQWSGFTVMECGGKQSFFFFAFKCPWGKTINFTPRASNLCKHTQPLWTGVFSSCPLIWKSGWELFIMKESPPQKPTDHLKFQHNLHPQD